MRIPDKIASARKIHVLGVAGQEGRAVFDYLLSAGIEVVGHSSTPENEFKETFLSFSDAYEELEARKMAEKFSASEKMVFGEDYAKGIKDGDVVIVPQAYRRLSLNNPIIEMSESGKITLVQAIEFAFSIVDCRLIGVTGTAGKSTVSAIIGNILKVTGVPFYFSGNDRENKWDFFALEKLPKDGFALFEISHRHLMNLKQSPNIAVITNIFPHHLDDAGSYENYIEIKKNICRFQTAGDVAIINRSLVENGIVKESEEISGELVLYGGEKIGVLYKGKEVKISLSDFKLSGEHNIQNANAAMLAGLACGFSVSAVEEGIKTFRGLKYRQEFIGEYGGIKIINDGKSTDPLATIEAVKAVKNIGALILGGVREGFSAGDFIPLGEIIAGAGIKNVFIFGSSKNDMASDLSRAGVLSKICDTLEDAVLEAKTMAKFGEAVVFSPGCQSFDEFRDYRHRALAFNSAVEKVFKLIPSVAGIQDL